MKKFLSFCALVCVVLSFQSCITLNTPMYCNAEGTIGSKVGEATSTTYCYLWSSKGKKQTLKEAAQNGGITKITQVENQNQFVLGGLVIKCTTRVYGD